MKNIGNLVLFLICFSITTVVFGEKSKHEKTSKVKSTFKSAGERCRRAQASSELNINNVRARINVGGNMWFDGSIARYIIPRDGNASSLFCGALWVGGMDGNGQLRLAAMRFGQEGDDFWPGPLTADGTAYVDASICNEYDRHFKINKADVENFISMCDPITHQFLGDPDLVPDIIKSWPAHGDISKKQSKFLAPFKDVDSNGVYEWEKGDYPYYDFENELCPKTIKAGLKPGQPYIPRPTKESDPAFSNMNNNILLSGGLLVDQVLKGDQTLWWIMNDKGNTHTESGGEPIGLEIRAQAFAFNTNDEVNNMTFYTYEIINRSTYVLNQTYFSQWVDPDLGYPSDDFVGCDVRRGLGYCYNGKQVDGPGVGAYSGTPPAVGIDFFQGPYMDPDGIDNPKLDIERMKSSSDPRIVELLNRNVTRGGYSIFDSVTGNWLKFDTIRLTEDADEFLNYWHFIVGDSVGNRSINGVNFGNTIVDDERFGMRRFVYYNNSGDARSGDPSKALDYYNYLRGRWKDGQRMTFGGPGYGENSSTIECDFMFPGTTDPWNWGTDGKSTDGVVNDPKGWTEESSQNQPGDRRFMQSAGPFTLKPGAVNYITVGIPWAQASTGTPYASVDLLKLVDDKCQALFDNCFKLIDGPDAPSLTISSLSNQLILFLSYDNPASNNYGEKYQEIDNTINKYRIVGDSIVDSVWGLRPSGDTIWNFKTEEKRAENDRYYRFEGYQIYQLVDKNASINDIGDPQKAKLVAQCDLENFDQFSNAPIGTLVNFEKDNNTGGLVGNVKVRGANKGVRHSFVVTEDLFARGIDKRLVNYREYYFIAVAYAYNNFFPYSQTDANYIGGQKMPYLMGRKHQLSRGVISPVVAIPSDPLPRDGGTIVQSDYGTTPVITRVNGFGNGGLVLNLSQASLEDIVKRSVNNPSDNEATELVYERNAGPVNVRVVDPLNVKPGEFLISFAGAKGDSSWFLTRTNGEPIFTRTNRDGTTSIIDTIFSETTLKVPNEQLILELGISIKIADPGLTATAFRIVPRANSNNESGAQGFPRNGGAAKEGVTLGGDIFVQDPSKAWLQGINDDDAVSILNWVRSGESFASQDLIRRFTSGNVDVTPNEEYLFSQQDYYYLIDSIIDGEKRNDSLVPPKLPGIDVSSQFESVLSGTWAPYRLTSTEDYHPGFSLKYYFHPDIYNPINLNNYRFFMNPAYNNALLYNDLNNLSSVRIVFTADQSKWSRCPVIEMSEDYLESEGEARKFQLRKAKSVDKNGNPIEDPQHPTGMGWFPGYAINLETGERLNIMFGEDSRYPAHNGRDMMWNPTSSLLDGMSQVLGGRHFIYVIGSNNIAFKDLNPSTTTNNIQPVKYICPAYDEGEWAYSKLKTLDNLAETLVSTPRRDYVLYDSAALVFANVSWVSMPIVNNMFAFKNPKDIPTDYTVQLLVKRPYSRGYNARSTNLVNPQYRFGLSDDIITLRGVSTNPRGADDKALMKSLLDRAVVVPNPYYNRGGYDTESQLQSKVRIVSLVPGSVVSIYALDGTLVRRLEPAVSTFVEWDLLNHTGQQIAGGQYLFHINMPNIGETVVRWFGSMRQADINSFPVE